MIRAIEAGDRRKAASFLCNVLESATIKRYEVISKLKEMMKEAGAMASLMSGSGPTVFGLAKTREQAEKIAAAVRLPDVDVFITKTIAK